MTVAVSQAGTEVTLKISGRIDTNTSAQLQNEILKAFQNAKRLILDFEMVPYISSAGLRALLIGQKTAASKGTSMELVNVSGVVLSVLESVGFSKILTIIK